MLSVIHVVHIDTLTHCILHSKLGLHQKSLQQSDLYKP